ncbi:MAG: ParB/RepB/Spo0J family partition protein [Gammaproteobacteria bacterium]|nr:ParB/RepB/Spo0J family partition protein [Gammaproteobacteria bacterium]
MTTHISRFEDLAIDDIVVDRFQVRTTNTGELRDELIASIKEFGLIHPIIVCRSERFEGKWEVVCGQRRLLAHKTMGEQTIKAGIIDQVLNKEEGTAVSANENIHQLQMSRPDLVDLCEQLHLRYGSLRAVEEKTKIPYYFVKKYVRLGRLNDTLRTMVLNKEVGLDLALKAQDATQDLEEALEFLDVLKRSDNDLRKKILKVKEQDPSLNANDAQIAAEKVPDDVRISGRLYGAYADAIRQLAGDKDSNVSAVGIELIEEALDAQGLVADD